MSTDVRTAGLGPAGSRWLPAVGCLLVALAAVAWVWTAARSSTTSYPSALLQGQGVLLTALVFMLGFAQSSLRRSSDATLREIQAWEANLRRLLEQPGAFTTLDLFAVAEKARDAAVSVSVLLDQIQREPRRWRRRLRDFEPGWRGASFEHAGQLSNIDRELARTAGEPDVPSTRRRRYLAKQKAQIESTRATLFEDASDLGVRGGSRLQKIGGEFALSVSVVSSQLRAARLYIAVMLTLGVLGIVYVDRSTFWLPAPELWVALAFPALAASYAVLLGSDVSREAARVDRALEDTWPVVLERAEALLGRLYESDDPDPQLSEVIQFDLDSLLDTTGSVGWYQTIQARLDLHGPLTRLANQDVADLLDSDRVRLGRAARLLRSAIDDRADDPVAAVAYAKALEIGAAVHETESSATMVGRAVDVLGSMEVPRTAFGRYRTGAWVACRSIKQQTLLHPYDAQLTDRLLAVLEDEDERALALGVGDGGKGRRHGPREDGIVARVRGLLTSLPSSAMQSLSRRFRSGGRGH